MKTFLQRKILRTLAKAKEAGKRNRDDLSCSLYSSAGYLLGRLSRRESLTLFED